MTDSHVTTKYICASFMILVEQSINHCITFSHNIPQVLDLTIANAMLVINPVMCGALSTGMDLMGADPRLRPVPEIKIIGICYITLDLDPIIPVDVDDGLLSRLIN